MESLGEQIRRLREEQNMQLRKVAAYIDVDQAILSKIEHGIRNPKREQVVQLAQYFKVDEKELLIKWLAEKVLAELNADELSLDAINMAKAIIRSKQSEPNDEPVGVIDYLKLGERTADNKLFQGDQLPSYMEFARYLYKTTTGKSFSEDVLNAQTGFIGEDLTRELYLFYKPNQDWLKNNALTLNLIKNLPDYNGKKRMVFASLKYVDDETCKAHFVEFGKIPY